MKLPLAALLTALGAPPWRAIFRNALAAALVPVLGALANAAGAAPADPLWDGFREPPTSVRPLP